MGNITQKNLKERLRCMAKGDIGSLTGNLLFLLMFALLGIEGAENNFRKNWEKGKKRR